MQKLEVPDPCLFADFRLWLGELVRNNSAKDSFFSIRWLALKTKWPPSLFSEVMSGKRAVTIGRALELGRFLKMSPTKMERLVLLSLATHDDANVRRHFATEAAKRRSRSRIQIAAHSISPGIYLGLAIRALLEFDERPLSQSDIMNSLMTCGAYSKEDFTRVLADLISSESISATGDLYQIAKGDGASDSITAKQSSPEERLRLTEEILGSIAQFQLRANASTFKKRFQMKMRSMSEVEFEELLERWNDLSQLIDSFDNAAKYSPKNAAENVNLYQVCFFAFPISGTCQ